MKKWKFQSPVSGRTRLRDFSQDFRIQKIGPLSTLNLNNFKYASASEAPKVKRKFKLELAKANIQDKTDQLVVVTWGSGAQGALGLGSLEDFFSPQIVSSLSNRKIRQIACGAGSSYVLVQNEFFAWGYNVAGQLGVGDFSDRKFPVRVKWNYKGIQKIAAGAGHCLALTDQGEVFAWGSGGFYQTGLGIQDNLSIPTKLGLEGEAKDISCGIQHSLVLVGHGVFAFGDNSQGQCSEKSKYYKTPKWVLSVDKITQVAAGGAHSLLLTRKQQVLAFGLNNCGQLGVGKDISNLCKPTFVRLKNQKQSLLGGVVQIQAGQESSGVLTVNKNLLVWGWNACGQLGQGHFSNLYYPTSVEIPLISNFSLGVSATCFVTELGQLFTCGWVGQYKSIKESLMLDPKLSLPTQIFDQTYTAYRVQCGRTHAVAFLKQEKPVIYSSRSQASECVQEQSHNFSRTSPGIQIQNDTQPRPSSITNKPPTLKLPWIHLKQDQVFCSIESDQLTYSNSKKSLQNSSLTNSRILQTFQKAKEQAREKAKKFRLFENLQEKAPKTSVRHTQRELTPIRTPNIYTLPNPHQSSITAQNIRILKNKIERIDSIMKQNQTSKPISQISIQLRRTGGGFRRK